MRRGSLTDVSRVISGCCAIVGTAIGYVSPPEICFVAHFGVVATHVDGCIEIVGSKVVTLVDEVLHTRLEEYNLLSFQYLTIGRLDAIDGRKGSAIVLDESNVEARAPLTALVYFEFGY